MVKRQKEKQYQSSAEHRLNSQIRSGRGNGSGSSRPLPFTCCALTLTPYTNPVCCIIPNKDSNDDSGTMVTGLNGGIGGRKINNHGIIFENTEIIPYLLKHRKNPITGEKMSSKSLVTLNMDPNEDEEDSKKHKWQCPILNKPFLNHTKIVAIVSKDRTSANVYSYEAVQTLNIKAKNYTDLISGEKFNPKKDMILLNDTNDESLAKLRDINNFVHMKTLRKDHQGNNGSNGEGGINGNIQMSISAKRIMDKLQTSKKEQAEKERVEKKRKQQEMEEEEEEDLKANGKRDYKKMKILTCDLGITYTKGQISGSLTSTSLPSYSSATGNDIREATQEEILSSLFNLMKKLKRKAFVRMITNLGHMDIELHCDIAPRTCMNFIGLVEKGWYDGTQFHRLIRNFMIQGGGSKNRRGGSGFDKKKKKKGDDEQSIWGEPFEDEFDQRLKHVGPGVLSMANAGKNTNKCQFFITFKSAPHLDNKHSVFGKVVKGLDILRQMENIPTDKSNDKPAHDVFIEKMVLFGDNPVNDAEEIEEKKIKARMEERLKNGADRKASALGLNTTKVGSSKTSGSADVMKNGSEPSKPQIGKYLQQTLNSKKSKHGTQTKQTSKDDDNTNFVQPSRLPPPPKKTKFGNFSGW